MWNWSISSQIEVLYDVFQFYFLHLLCNTPAFIFLSTNTNAPWKEATKSEVPVQEGVVSIPESGPRMLVLTDVGEAGSVGRRVFREFVTTDCSRFMFFFKFMKMFCLECLAFVEKYGILNPTWFPMFRIHFLVFSPLQGDRWWSFAVVAASALERISTSGGDPECKSLTISLPKKFEISFRLGRLSIQNENAWGMFWKISAIHFSRGFKPWRLTLSLWLDRPWSARPVGLGDLMDGQRLQG